MYVWGQNAGGGWVVGGKGVCCHGGRLGGGTDVTWGGGWFTAGEVIQWSPLGAFKVGVGGGGTFKTGGGGIVTAIVWVCQGGGGGWDKLGTEDIFICGVRTGVCGFQGGGGSVLGISCGGVGSTCVEGGGGAAMAFGVSLRSNKTPVAGLLMAGDELSSFNLMDGGGGPSPSSAISDMYCINKTH